jgi:UDP-glucose 4-epimerase
MSLVLVTGAAGQIGSRLVRQLLGRNYEVRGLILPGDPNRSRLNGLEIEVVEGNMLDMTVCEKAIEGVDAVIHTANLVGPLPGMSETDFFDNNVRNTFNIVYAASKRADKLQRLVYISSSSVYPNDAHVIATCYNPVDEMHPLRPLGTYALGKLIGEQIVTAHARQTGLRTAIIRPSGIASGTSALGRWSVGFVCAILRTGQNNPKSSLYMNDGTELWHELEAAVVSRDQLCAIRDSEGRPWVYQFVDARDVAHGCVCALESGAAIGEVFNVSAPRPITYDEATQVIAKATGQSILEWQTPVRWLFDLDNTKAKCLIGYRPKWGIEEMVASALVVQRGESDGMV